MPSGESEENENDKTKWNRKKKFIIDNFNEAIKDREKALDEVSRSQQNLNRVTGVLSDEILRIQQMQNIYQNNNVYLHFNPVTEGSFDVMMSLSISDASNATTIASAASKIRTNTESLLGTAIATGSTVSSMVSTTVHLSENMENKEAIFVDLKPIVEPTPYDRRIELSSKLSEIEPRLSTKLDGAWQTIQDKSKEDRFLQSASSARELISDLLHLLAPDDQVAEMEWFAPETENGRPSQRQRSRFAILGRNNALEEIELKAIYDLGDNIRDSYRRLNRIAHLRNYEEDLQRLTATLIDYCQIYLLKLLELRSIYFKS